MDIRFRDSLTVNPGWQAIKTLSAIGTQMETKNYIDILDRLLEQGAMTRDEYVKRLKEIIEK